MFDDGPDGPAATLATSAIVLKVHRRRASTMPRRKPAPDDQTPDPDPTLEDEIATLEDAGDEEEFDPADLISNDQGTRISKTTREAIKKLSVEEKKRTALALRLSGSTYLQIGRALDIDASTARGYVVGLMKTLQTETAEQIKQVQFLRLEHMLMLTWPGVQEKKLGEMNMALSIMDRQTRLLGLDSAMKVELGIAEGTVIDVAGDKDSFLKALEAGRMQVQKALEKAAEEESEIIDVVVISEAHTNGHPDSNGS